MNGWERMLHLLQSGSCQKAFLVEDQVGGEYVAEIQWLPPHATVDQDWDGCSRGFLRVDIV